MKKRLLSILMICSMVLSMLPAVSYAETGKRVKVPMRGRQLRQIPRMQYASIQMGLPVTTTVNTTISITVNGKEIRSNGLCLMIKPIQAKTAFSCCLRV